MAYFERVRDVISQPFSPEIIRQRTQSGWQMVSIEWRRELPDQEAPTEGGAFSEDIPFGLRISDDCMRLEVHPQEQAVTNIGIRTNFFADIYAAVGEPDPAKPGAYVTRLYHHPLVPWIWVGAVIMVFGGIVSLTDRRLRVGAPNRRPVSLPDAALTAE